MPATQRLELRQAQSLVMTPQLQQAIKLLQLSNLDLCAYVDSELEQNPLLERDSDDSQGQEKDQGEPPDNRAEGTGGDSRDTWEQIQGGEGFSDTEGPLDADYENVFDGDRFGSNTPGASSIRNGSASFDNASDASFEQRLSQAPTLRQHLVDQLQIELQDPGQRLIGLHLIDMLSESGYLSGDLDSVCTLLSCSGEAVQEVLQCLQGFEPTGIFARSLGECLALQLAELNRLDPAMKTLLDHLDLVARGEHASLRRLCGVDDEDLVDMLRELRALDPKPALKFEVEPAEPIVPDIFMRPTRTGGWHIELNSETLPRVLVNNQYYAEILSQAHSQRDRNYLSERYQEANWLVKALHQRATTILKVASEIVRQQDAFFRKGVAHMKPLTLRVVAEAIEMHESTVSRVTSNKYMMTPRGIFELKYFFSSSIAGTDGGSHSAEAIRHRIKVLIDGESPDHVLSDDSLVELLREQGIDIARRTVAKYREALRIPSSVRRRREKAAAR